jgi:hypothetical protein
MEGLPIEIRIYLLDFLSFREIRFLLLTSKSWNWISFEVRLWRRLAKEDRDFPAHLFDIELKNFRGPIELYRRIIRCRGTRSDWSEFNLDCDRPSIRGTSFCREHCEQKGIPICSICDRTRAKYNFLWIDRSGPEVPGKLGNLLCQNCVPEAYWILKPPVMRLTGDSGPNFILRSIK